MVRVAVIADIHGNLTALDAVLADLAGAGVDRVVCLGDVAATGPSHMRRPCDSARSAVQSYWATPTPYLPDLPGCLLSTKRVVDSQRSTHGARHNSPPTT
jgi:hypothetical protein